MFTTSPLHEMNFKISLMLLLSFPADEERKSQWTKIIQKARLDEFWKSSKRSVICSSHFEEQYIYCTKSGLKRLKKEAFPNKNLAPGMIETPAELSDLQIPTIGTQPSSTISNSETDDGYSLDLDK
ncbi:unnamed protein product [Euphydryas editha]|uniref:THAP-type domain-containing protein n=1 Tax=Euphydryas editha TaxID=104508 RepID=A0AAU9UJQ7_EUPED|nr:unnamed protein product [Euphydryas editha]